MRRLALLFAGVALIASLPAQAQQAAATHTSSVALTDARGDWAVPMQDVVSGRLEVTTRQGVAESLRLTAVMASGLTGTPGDYDFIVGGRVGAACHYLAVRVRWTGASVAQAYRHDGTFACQSQSQSLAEVTAFGVELLSYAVGGGEVVASETVNGLVALVDAPTWLRPGGEADFTIFTHPPVTATLFGIDGQLRCTCDFAYLTKPWRVGT